MFGATPPPQNEDTPFYPRSPYGAAKVYCVLDDPELPRGVRHVRGQRHPVQPRVPAAGRDLRDPQDRHGRGARSRPGKQDDLYLGNLDAVRDWGYAQEYVEAHVADAAARRADGLRGGHRHGLHASATSSQFCFEHVGLDWEKYVQFDERYLRPTEVDALIGDPTARDADAGLEGAGL